MPTFLGSSGVDIWLLVSAASASADCNNTRNDEEIDEELSKETVSCTLG
jgi:hypothetical protein